MSTGLTVFLPSKQLLVLYSNPAAPVVEGEAHKRRDEIIERSKNIERVVGGASQKAAVAVIDELSTLLKQVESDRKAVKEPFRKAGEAIDAAAKAFVKEAEAEKARVKLLVDKFQAEEIRKAEEARRAQEAELERLRMERLQAEAAQRLAQTAKQEQKAAEQILATDLKAAEVIMQPVKAPVRADNMVVRVSWVAEVTDVHALYKAFPELVTVEPRMREINKALADMAKLDPEKPPTLPGCVVTKKVDTFTR